MSFSVSSYPHGTSKADAIYVEEQLSVIQTPVPTKVSWVDPELQTNCNKERLGNSADIGFGSMSQYSWFIIRFSILEIDFKNICLHDRQLSAHFFCWKVSFLNTPRVTLCFQLISTCMKACAGVNSICGDLQG